MLDPRQWSVDDLAGCQTPLLTVIVDAEEEFDWSQPYSRANVSVTHMRNLVLAQRILERYGAKPIYMVDYAVATQPSAYFFLQELHLAGKCEIGAHLHPWVNPPFDERVNIENSFPGNLPVALEHAKLETLTAAIERAFGVRAVVYRAGRFGVGPWTAQTLETLGYEIDTSVVPRTDFRNSMGPDFSRCGHHPYWFGTQRRLLELPLTVGWVGAFATAGKPLYNFLQMPAVQRFQLPGVCARLRLFERLRLTPEGITISEMRRLAKAMFRSGLRVFSLTYHSPSLAPGNTPYVRNEDDLGAFLGRLDRFLEFFMSDLRGQPASPLQVRDFLLRRNDISPHIAGQIGGAFACSETNCSPSASATPRGAGR